ncbi:hypothetical protein J2S19_001698 [Metabacillus malikii]|uniref:Uncharacterized protein n=1 Tax=Metabacillus malikii TaxID=1504265 RepID=A0ABT9ZDU9_9BACI|nr:hypothetical protein [Metabacillus malikii]
MQNEKIRLKEYRELLLKKKAQEEIKIDVINELNLQRGQGLTSPTSGTSTEETRLLMEYIDRANIFNISKRDEQRGKILKYRKFFKSKRNQQVEIYFKCGKEVIYKEGKVSTIGRDFVMLTNLRDRIWIKYDVITSANIPFGIPNYSNTHQHYLYDNQLRKKLLTQFGQIVSKRDILKQQFYEESLQTNLLAWEDTWLIIHTNEHDRKIGKLHQLEAGMVTLSVFNKRETVMLQDIYYIETIRFINILRHVYQSIRK